MTLLPSAACALALALVLGGLALEAARYPARGLERFALSLGAGVALTPLLWWASHAVGWRWNAPGLRVLVTGGGLILAALHVRRRVGDFAPRRGRKGALPPSPTQTSPESPATTAFAAPSALDPGRAWRACAWGLLLLALASRGLQARALVAPAWVDGYHHSVVSELFIRHGAVPSDFSPFLEGVPFYYHFGFHALAASAALLSGTGAATAVLATGQLLSAMTAATTWALARRMTGSELAAAVAAAVPAAWHFFPAYYVSWARYTQLAGLVVLPVAWLLLSEAMRGRAGSEASDQAQATGAASLATRSGPLPVLPRAAPTILAAAVAAGLALVHYRVLAFYAVGALVLAAQALLERRPARLARLAATAALAMLMAGGWLLGPFRRGVARLAADRAAVASEAADAAARAGDASPATDAAAWWAWGAAVDSLPRWLFTIELNGILLVLATFALVAALLAGRRGADALLAGLLLALLLVHPTWFGLPSSWLLPRFAVAISSWLPTALALALGAALVAGGLARAAGEGAFAGLPRGLTRRAPAIAATLLLVASTAAAWRQRDVANADTVLLRAADRVAADWVRANTPPEAAFLIPTGHWHLGSYRGLDGGYWLPLLAERRTSMPLSFYAYGAPERVRAVRAVAEQMARGDALDDAGLERLLHTTGATWIYVGPASRGEAGELSAERLRRHPQLAERYAADGVAIFEYLRPDALRDRPSRFAALERLRYTRRPQPTVAMPGPSPPWLGPSP